MQDDVTQAPYTYQAYPKVVYHETLGREGVTVRSPEEQAALGAGWVESPAGFAPPPAEPTPDEVKAENADLKARLERLEALVAGGGKTGGGKTGKGGGE